MPRPTPGGFVWLLLAALALVPSARADVGRCVPARVTVAPVAGSNFSQYEGVTPTHRIRFVSERPGEQVDAFPEPPVRIIRRATGASCAIREGGVWSATGVYVGAGGRRVMLLESSGSGADIVFYDAASCVRRAEIDVSQARWRFVDGGVDIGRDCTGSTIDECRTRQTTRLTPACLPARH